MELKANKLKLLDETVLYYSENTKRRCLHLDEDKVTCCYSGINNIYCESDGCAIGRIIPKELAEQFDEHYTFKDKNARVITLFGLLPQEIQNYGISYLTRLQALHDKSSNWCENGLSSDGENYVKQFKLDIENNLI